MLCSPIGHWLLELEKKINAFLSSSRHLEDLTCCRLPCVAVSRSKIAVNDIEIGQGDGLMVKGGVMAGNKTCVKEDLGVR